MYTSKETMGRYQTTKPPAAPKGCLCCGRARGETRQALIARLHGGFTLWLCDDCAVQETCVARLLAAYRAARVS